MFCLATTTRKKKTKKILAKLCNPRSYKFYGYLMMILLLLLLMMMRTMMVVIVTVMMTMAMTMTMTAKLQNL